MTVGYSDVWNDKAHVSWKEYFCKLCYLGQYRSNLITFAMAKGPKLFGQQSQTKRMWVQF